MTIYTLTAEPDLRQWAGGLTRPPRMTRRNAVVAKGTMPAPDYPIPTMARRLIEALHAAGELWELIVHEHEDTVEVRHYHPGQWPAMTAWKWKNGRRHTGTAVRDTLTALADRLETR